MNQMKNISFRINLFIEPSKSQKSTHTFVTFVTGVKPASWCLQVPWYALVTRPIVQYTGTWVTRLTTGSPTLTGDWTTQTTVLQVSTRLTDPQDLWSFIKLDHLFLARKFLCTISAIYYLQLKNKQEMLQCLGLVTSEHHGSSEKCKIQFPE